VTHRRALFFVILPLALAAAVALAVALGLAASSDGDPPLRADAIDPPREAPATRGRGADGGRVELARGRPALVTFLFAECPDVCPLLAERIRAALDDLGPGDARGLQVLAVSVDPRGDTPRAVRRFLRTHGLQGRMDYIVGSRAELEPVWQAWLVAAQSGNARESIHSARVVLVDRDGRQVGSYAGGIPFAPADLAADLRALL
jgi:protein SCO1/2